VNFVQRWRGSAEVLLRELTNLVNSLESLHEDGLTVLKLHHSLAQALVLLNDLKNYFVEPDDSVRKDVLMASGCRCTSTAIRGCQFAELFTLFNKFLHPLKETLVSNMLRQLADLILSIFTRFVESNQIILLEALSALLLIIVFEDGCEVVFHIEFRVDGDAVRKVETGGAQFQGCEEDDRDDAHKA